MHRALGHFTWNGVAAARGYSYLTTAGLLSVSILRTPDAFAESGRGLDLISSLGLGVRLGNDPAGGAFVLVTLPVDGAAAQPL